MSKLTLELFEVGSCEQLEKISIRNGRMKKIKFPALVGLINHPNKGYILFDTGYSHHFIKESSSIFSKIYKIATPIALADEDDLWYQLNEKGIEKKDIKYCIISHFHADHIAGLKSLHKDTKIVAYKEAYEHVRNLKGIKALKEAFIPELMPNDIDDKIEFFINKVKLPSKLQPFTTGYDVFGDETVYAVVLNGHAYEQIGIYIKPLNIFLCADAAWSLDAIKDNIPPLGVARIIKADYKDYIDNLSKLHQVYKNNSDMKIIPTHCDRTLQSLKGEVISE